VRALDRAFLPRRRSSTAPRRVRGIVGGEPLKTDAAAHGDDHFLPGPCDVAWDLAGAAAERGMDAAAEAALVAAYRRRSGDDAGGRLPAWRLAYVAVRTGWWRMAADALRGTAEHDGARREHARFRRLLAAAIATHRPAASRPA
jgi:hypothetical protein